MCCTKECKSKYFRVLASTLLQKTDVVTYMSGRYRENIDVEPLLIQIVDANLTEEDINCLICSLYSLFIKRSIHAIKVIQDWYKDEPKLGQVLELPYYVYQSVEARNLCRLWVLKYGKYHLEEDQE